MVKEKGEWYPIDTFHEKTLKPRYIGGRRYHRELIYTNKAKAEEHSKFLKTKFGAYVRIVPLMLVGKLFGYPDSIPHKKQVYVVFRAWK